MNKFSKLFVLSTLLVVFLTATVLAVEPFGATVNPLAPSLRAPMDLPDSDANAIAGNITEMDVSGFSITQSWQGYFGNVTGTIMLADNNDNVMYNWSLASPEGEIYASTNNSIIWSYIQCFNFLADGTYADDRANAGGTSEYGTNLTLLENEFGIAWDDVDGVNETFSLAGTHESGFGLTHDLFYTNNFEFTAGECYSTHLFAGNQNATDSTFQQVILYEPTTSSVVFASLLDEESPLGFDGRAHDFQMLVLENGHLTNTATTTYYFWVELE